MSSFLLYFLYILFGVISGVIGGLGMGGGTILIPLLTIFLKMGQKYSQAINLLSFIIMASIVLFLHNKNGYLKLEKIWIIIFSGIIFSILGAFIAAIVPTQTLRIAFGVFLCLLSIVSFIKLLKQSHWLFFLWLKKIFLLWYKKVFTLY